MGHSNLPLANGHTHAKAFERLGWTLDKKRRGRGKHLRLTKPGNRATLSIPDHREVKRTIIAELIKLTGESEEKYLRAFAGEDFCDRG
jgi:predicted RNA binding protein YcfA (HicA-like mRNA interferase family)